MKWAAQVVPQLVAGILFLLATIACLVVIFSAESLTSRETSILSLFLCFLSILATWFFAYLYSYFSRTAAAQEKIDTIAMQSIEKIMSLSVQLNRLEQFLDDAALHAEAAPDAQSALVTLKQRIEGASWGATTLRISNNTFPSDWKGIVSEELKSEIENQATAQNEALALNEQIGRALAGLKAGIDDEVVTQKLNELYQRLGQIRSSLPNAARPQSPDPPPPPAVSVSQSTRGDQTEHSAAGQLSIDLLRPVFSFTASGRLNPHMSDAPNVEVSLEDKPEGAPDIGMRAGTGTTFDFNVHLKSKVPGRALPVGEYRVNYSATSSESQTGQHVPG